MAAKIRDRHLYGDAGYIRDQYEEHVWIGRHAVRIDPDDPGHLIVFAIAPAKKKKKKVVVVKDDNQETEQVEKPRETRRGNGYNRTREV